MPDSDDRAAAEKSIQKLRERYGALREAIGKVIVGQEEVVGSSPSACSAAGTCW